MTSAVSAAVASPAVSANTAAPELYGLALDHATPYPLISSQDDPAALTAGS